MKSITLKINGQLYSKANSRIFSMRSDKPILFKNPKVAAYCEDAMWQLKTQLNSHEIFLGPLKMETTIWYQSRRSDLDVSLLQDILEKAGVYKNDRQIEIIAATRKIDKNNPRVLVTITELEEIAAK